MPQSPRPLLYIFLKSPIDRGIKYGVDFNDAVRAYYDPFRQDIFDEQHSTQEEIRWIYLGSVDGLVLFVVETEPDQNTVRIISARPALKREQEVYYANREKDN
ncbi:BrnT family toxin [Treponema primitia]|uniref:BrnT family toxin n=1 Tax=Treponema primitia TaxID=88058 RepID=UPI0039800AA5